LENAHIENARNHFLIARPTATRESDDQYDAQADQKTERLLLGRQGDAGRGSEQKQ
jgi:hypothetical protein